MAVVSFVSSGISESEKPYLKMKTAKDTEDSMTWPAFLRNPVFLRNRLLWGIGGILLVVLIDALIMFVTGAFSIFGGTGDLYDTEFPAYAVSLIAPIYFWIPVLMIARWTWGHTVGYTLTCIASAWMVVMHIVKICVVLSIREIGCGEIYLGIVLFCFGGLGIVVLVCNLVKNSQLIKPLCEQWKDRIQALANARALKRRTIKVKCPKCAKSFTATVVGVESEICCPRCGEVRMLVGLGPSIKEPIPCQLVRALPCILGFLGILGIVVLFLQGAIAGPVFFILDALCFGMNFALKKGMAWPRYPLLALSVLFAPSFFMEPGEEKAILCTFTLMFVFQTVALFTPGVNSWFFLKRGIRRATRGVGC